MGSLQGLDGPPHRSLMMRKKQNCIEGKGSREQPKGEEKDSERIH